MILLQNGKVIKFFLLLSKPIIVTHTSIWVFILGYTYNSMSSYICVIHIQLKNMNTFDYMSIYTGDILTITRVVVFFILEYTYTYMSSFYLI